jgi:A/G-specific adenine glycosylase
VSDSDKILELGELPTAQAESVEAKRAAIQEGLVRYSKGGELRAYPWRRRGRSPYEVLIAEKLLKRTTATAAARVYCAFLDRFPTVQSLHTAPQAEIAEALSSLGLQQQRAASFKKLAAYLIDKEGGRVPVELHSLLSVPGIGDYSARAVLSFALKIPAAVVDSNVERILQRVFKWTLPERPNTAQYQAVADSILPKKHHREFNLGMLDLGALVCRPSVPRCYECPIRSVCDYFQDYCGEVTDKNTTLVREREKLPPVASNVRRLRKEKGISLVELARLAGVSKLTIIKIEANRTTPRPETLAKVAAALHVNPDELSRGLT